MPAPPLAQGIPSLHDEGVGSEPGSTAIELRNDRQSTVPSPSPRRTGRGLGRGVSLVLARPSSPRPSPPLAGGEGVAAASCAGTSLIQRQCSPTLSPPNGERVGERGPFWPPGFTGRRIHWGLLSPALSSLGGGEGEVAASCAGTSLIQRQSSPALSSRGGEGESRAHCSRPPCAVEVRTLPAHSKWWYRQFAPAGAAERAATSQETTPWT